VDLARTTRRPRARARALAVLATAATLAGAGALAPTAATAAPGTAAEAAELVEQNAQRLTAVNEQVRQAELTVEEQQEQAAAAAAAADEAQAAMTALEPQLSAIAATGFTGRQSRVAAFLTSESADDLVQQMTTLDVIASHTETVVAAADAAQDRAAAARQEAERAAAQAEAGLAELEKQKAELQSQAEDHEAAFAELSAEEQARVTLSVAGPTLATPDTAELPVAPGSAAATAISVALSKVGAPYVPGGSGPDTFDCSGLTSYAYAAAGVTLPRTSRDQSGAGRPISRGDLQPGDLVFFYSPISHVGLYIGNGMMVHASVPGTPVAVTSVDQAGYAGAVRVVG
jgi:cell wall-associated NlpC family hydrolase